MTTVRISVGQQVAQEVAAIRAELAARGYSMRKHPRRAVWTIQVSPDEAYHPNVLNPDSKDGLATLFSGPLSP
ncbi:MAG: hypothetical protein ACFB8W_02120 [Elainellaceae cyanobacterium]